MLRPILSALGEWVPPHDLGRGEPISHFGQRAAERGVASIHGDILQYLIHRALAEGRGDLIEQVRPLCDETMAFRVLLPEGCFYPLIKGDPPRAVTCYDQKQMRQVKLSQRWRRRKSGTRARRSGPV